jgi:hypothetical protein
MALLRALPYGAALLILATGRARPISGAIAGCTAEHPRRARQLLAGLFELLIWPYTMTGVTTSPGTIITTKLAAGTTQRKLAPCS